MHVCVFGWQNVWCDGLLLCCSCDRHFVCAHVFTDVCVCAWVCQCGCVAAHFMQIGQFESKFTLYTIKHNILNMQIPTDVQVATKFTDTAKITVNGVQKYIHTRVSTFIVCMCSTNFNSSNEMFVQHGFVPLICCLFYHRWYSDQTFLVQHPFSPALSPFSSTCCSLTPSLTLSIRIAFKSNVIVFKPISYFAFVLILSFSLVHTHGLHSTPYAVLYYLCSFLRSSFPICLRLHLTAFFTIFIFFCFFRALLLQSATYTLMLIPISNATHSQIHI